MREREGELFYLCQIEVLGFNPNESAVLMMEKRSLDNFRVHYDYRKWQA